MNRSTATVLAIAALASSATAAQASTFGSDAFFSNGQGLSAGNAKSSATGHTNVWYVEGDANHTWCPSVAKGYSGYTSTPNAGTHFTAHSPMCGAHFQVWYPNGTSDIWFRGAAWNRNEVTFDVFSYARYGWF